MIVRKIHATWSEPLRDTALEQVTETVNRVFSDSDSSQESSLRANMDHLL